IRILGRVGGVSREPQPGRINSSGPKEARRPVLPVPWSPLAAEAMIRRLGLSTRGGPGVGFALGGGRALSRALPRFFLPLGGARALSHAPFLVPARRSGQTPIAPSVRPRPCSGSPPPAAPSATPTATPRRRAPKAPPLSRSPSS